MTSTRTFHAEIREVRPQPYLGRRLRAPLGGVGPKVQEAFAVLYRQLAQGPGQPAGPPFLIAQEPKDGYLEMEVGAPCASPPRAPEGFVAGTLPGGKVAVTVHRGPYDQLAGIYPLLATWIEEQGLDLAGPPREVYLAPPGEEPVTEVMWPVAAGAKR